MADAPTDRPDDVRQRGADAAPPGALTAGRSFLYPAVAFLAAFVIFSIQPLASKILMPLYGGTAAVWNASMLFFQGTLLIGYVAAHRLIRLSIPAQRGVFVGALFASTVWLAVMRGASWEGSGASPLLALLGTLVVQLGLPLTAISITAPLLQAWHAARYPGRSPYALYASSNAGSLVALLAYPLLIEPQIGVVRQLAAWIGAFGLATILIVALSSRLRGVSAKPPSASPSIATPLRAAWMWYPALSSVILLGVTNLLCHDVAPVPILLVLPLAVFLLTFVLCFSGRPIYNRPIYYALFILHFVAYAGNVLHHGGTHVLGTTLFLLFLLYAACMVCHGELYRLRPADDASLTTFYLSLSFGGFLGSAFTVLVAPLIFETYAELILGLSLLAVTITVSLFREGAQVFPGAPRAVDRFLLFAIPAAAIPLGIHHLGLSDVLVIHRARSFYGVITVFNAEHRTMGVPIRSLLHGQIIHGTQIRAPGRELTPIGYYGAHSALGAAFRALSSRPSLRIGVVGLGIGTATAYARPSDELRLYELNDDVIAAAHEYFSFLSRLSFGERSTEHPLAAVVRGDARLSLTAEQPNEFDLLLVDAFSSDSIPTHLLTKEAVALYLSHLSDDGVLLLHISNRHLELAPVVVSIAKSLDVPCRVLVRDNPPVGSGELVTTYAAMSKRPSLLEALGRVARAPDDGRPVVSEAVREGPLWTDDYSSLVGVMRLIPTREEIRAALGLLGKIVRGEELPKDR